MCGYVNGSGATPDVCTGPRKAYRIALGAGEFPECLDRASANKTIPAPGYLTLEGKGRFSTSIKCDAPSGNKLGVDLSDRVTTFVRGLSINTSWGGSPLGSRGGANFSTENISANQALSGKQCIGGANDKATCTVDSQCPNGYCSPDPQILMAGRGNQTITLDNTWTFGTVGGSGTGVLFEKWPTLGCVNDPERYCTFDGNCPSGKCSTRSCINKHWQACYIDADCGGAFGSCVEPLWAWAQNNGDNGGSLDFWLYKSMVQPDAISSNTGCGLDVRGRACGGEGINERIIESQIYSGGSGNSGICFSAGGTVSGGGSCASATYNIEASRIDNLGTALGTSLSVGASTQVNVASLDYDPTTRSIAGTLNYSAGLVSGGKSWLGVVASDPPTPVSGECWYNKTSHLLKCRSNTTTRTVSFNPSTAVGDLFVGQGTANASTALAIGANSTILASNGTTPVWTDFSTGAAPFTGYQLMAGRSGAQTLTLSTNNTGSLTLSGSGSNAGTLTLSSGAADSAILGSTTGSLRVSGGSGSGADLYLNSTTAAGKGDIRFQCDATNTSCLHSMDGTSGRFSINALDCTTPGNAELCVTGGATVSSPGNTLANAVVTRAATQTLTNKTLTSPVISTISNTGTITVPTTTGTLALLGNKLSDFASTTSAELYGTISNETGSATGSPLAVFNQGPTIYAPTLTGNTTVTALIPAGGSATDTGSFALKDTSGTTHATITDSSSFGGRGIFNSGRLAVALGNGTGVVLDCLNGVCVESFDGSGSLKLSTTPATTSAAASAVTNTTAETTIVGTVTNGSLTLPANFWRLGKVIRLMVTGTLGTNSPAHTLNLKVKAGSTVLCSTGANTPTASLSGRFFKIEAYLQARSAPGASANIQCNGLVTIMPAATSTAAVLWELSGTAQPVAIATNASQALGVTATWGTGANTSDTITGDIVSIESLN